MEKTNVLSFIDKVRDVYFGNEFYDLKPTQQTHLTQIMSHYDKVEGTTEVKDMAKAIAKEG